MFTLRITYYIHLPDQPFSHTILAETTLPKAYTKSHQLPRTLFKQIHINEHINAISSEILSAIYVYGYMKNTNLNDRNNSAAYEPKMIRRREVPLFLVTLDGYRFLIYYAAKKNHLKYYHNYHENLQGWSI